MVTGNATACQESVYVNPLNGTTAYNTDTAMAATADTNFGTSLGGFTAADATVAAATDVGINSFHSASRLNNATGTSTLAGAELGAMLEAAFAADESFNVQAALQAGFAREFITSLRAAQD